MHSNCWSNSKEVLLASAYMLLGREASAIWRKVDRLSQHPVIVSSVWPATSPHPPTHFKIKNLERDNVYRLREVEKVEKCEAINGLCIFP